MTAGGHTFSRLFAPPEDLAELCSATAGAGLSEKTCRLFTERASLRPHVRLAKSLDMMLSQALEADWERVEDCLSEEERRALDELDRSSLPLRIKEIGHGVLDVHCRWQLMKSVGRLFREARRLRKNVLGAVRLDDVLGEKGADDAPQ